LLHCLIPLWWSELPSHLYLCWESNIWFLSQVCIDRLACNGKLLGKTAFLITDFWRR
jgi:hypothetical protein